MSEKELQIEMKKLKNFCFTLLFCMISVMMGALCFVIKPYAVELTDFNKHEIVYEKKSDIDICETFGWLDDSWAEMADDQLSLINPNILEAFKESDWKMVVSKKNLNEFCNEPEDGPKILGTTDFNSETIYLNPTQNSINEATIHEMGHWLDRRLLTISDSEKFQDVFEKEHQRFRYHFYDIDGLNTHEMFAEAFFQYYIDGEKLKTLCPETYNFIDNVVSHF